MKLYRITFVVNGERLYGERWAANLSAAWNSAEKMLADEYFGRAELRAAEYVCDWRE